MDQETVATLKGTQRGPNASGRYRNPLTGQWCTEAAYNDFWTSFDAALGDESNNRPVTTTMSARDVTRAKLPAWSTKDPAQWFKMADRVFQMYPDATETDKFGTALAVVPEEIYTRHTAAWEASTTPWTALKQSVTGASTKSPQQLFTQLLDLPMASTPSDYVREAVAIMKKVPGKDGKAQTLSTFQGWLAKNLAEQKMPVHLRPTLAAVDLDADDMQSYVDRADQLWGSDVAAQRRVTVSAVEANLVSAVKGTGSAKGSVAKNANKGGNRSSGGGNRNGRPGNRLVDGKCWVHVKFGAEAYSCANPTDCSMKQQVKAKARVADIKDETE